MNYLHIHTQSHEELLTNHDVDKCWLSDSKLTNSQSVSQSVNSSGDVVFLRSGKQVTVEGSKVASQIVNNF